MDTFKKNMINLWGSEGEQWLSQLPHLITILAAHWSLTDITPVNNMTWNYVALASQSNKKTVVLKISFDEQLILNEYKTLRHFNGHGAVQVLDINTTHYAILMEQAIPGFLLKEQYPHTVENTIQIYADVVKSLAAQPMPTQDPYNHMSTWCKAIDRISDRRIASRLIDKAHALKLMLLSTVKKEYLCHADLHLENIIQQGDSWVVIDPKGIIGEMVFEAAAFDLLNTEDIITHVTLLADALQLEFNRLLAWIFLRLIISAQWFIEDGGNPDERLLIATKIYPLLK